MHSRVDTDSHALGLARLTTCPKVWWRQPSKTLELLLYQVRKMPARKKNSQRMKDEPTTHSCFSPHTQRQLELLLLIPLLFDPRVVTIWKKDGNTCTYLKVKLRRGLASTARALSPGAASYRPGAASLSPGAAPAASRGSCRQ